MPFGKGIAGHVAETGVSMNIKDAYNCEVFHSVVDRQTGFHTKTVLCCAVTDTSGKRIAVIQVRCGASCRACAAHALGPVVSWLGPSVLVTFGEPPEACRPCRPYRASASAPQVQPSH